jgi:hypothetical protein
LLESLYRPPLGESQELSRYWGADRITRRLPDDGKYSGLMRFDRLKPLQNPIFRASSRKLDVGSTFHLLAPVGANG